MKCTSRNRPGPPIAHPGLHFLRRARLSAFVFAKRVTEGQLPGARGAHLINDFCFIAPWRIGSQRGSMEWTLHVVCNPRGILGVRAAHVVFLLRVPPEFV